MRADRFARVSEILLGAADLGLDERQAYLDRECGGDSELRAEVESMLAHDGHPTEMLRADSAQRRKTRSPTDSSKMTGRVFSHYRILGELGQGGMGVVYRARDTRLSRDVALKVIAPEYSRDPDRLRRFEQEARAAGALNHPNVVAIFDIGTHEGSPFVVMELLEGETLRQRLQQGPLPVRKAIDFTTQVAHGLAAAHEKGILHRDLKPENLFLTKDGRVKVLDFGLAKLTGPDAGAGGEETASVAMTGTGVVLGTAGYMAPEQVRGRAADPRADLFALGVILYEMLTGKRAFQGESTIETLNAILTEDPPPLSASGRDIPPGLETIVQRCIEKEASQRFESARDVVFALEVAAAGSGTGITALTPPPRLSRRRLVVLALAAVVLVASYAGLFLWTRQTVKAPVPSFTRVTFRRGEVASARFSPDGHTVVYSASWEGNPVDVFSQRLGMTDARPLGLRGATVVATAGGEMAVLLENRTLARVPLEGGTPREVLENAQSADWNRDGTRLLVSHSSNGRFRLEYPVGKTLVERAGFEFIVDPRFSPTSDQIAFIQNYAWGAPNGDIVVVDFSGRQRVLSKGWENVGGLAWSPDGREVWFTATRTGTTRALYAVTLSGKERLVARVAGNLVLQDVARDGRVLLVQVQGRFETRGRMAGDTAERDLSWLDGTYLGFPSADGTRLVFEENGEGGGAIASTYFRRMDGSPPVRLSDGEPMGVSPDWKWVVCRAGFTYPQNGIKIVPIGAGETKVLPRGTVREFYWAWWHPDGKRIFIWGSEAGKSGSTFIQDLPDGLPRPVHPEDVTERGDLSPAGRFVLGAPPGGGASVLYPVGGGEQRVVPGLKAEDFFLGWSEDSRSLFFRTGPTSNGVGPVPARVVKLDIETGRAQPWLELAPPDRTGVQTIEGVRITPNGSYYTYSYRRSLSDLYLVEGLK